MPIDITELVWQWVERLPLPLPRDFFGRIMLEARGGQIEELEVTRHSRRPRAKPPPDGEGKGDQKH